MTRILIVDDSRVSRDHLVHILSADPEISISGIVADGSAAIEFLARTRVDVVLMDVEMPILDGFRTTERIMAERPLPIVMISAGWNAGEVEKTFRALEVGALAILEKPAGPASPDYERVIEEMRRTVKAMATIRVGRRVSLRPRPARSENSASGCKESETPPMGRPSSPYSLSHDICAEAAARMVFIGASTGGPAVLSEILGSLTPGYPWPILIVQHIATGFIQGLADWLGSATGIKVVIATDKENPCAGNAYLAPDGLHMIIGSDKRIRLVADVPDAGLRPSVAHLFGSAAEALGPDAIGILLTGMGQDGAIELAAMRRKGAVTIAQDKASSIVFGMPGEAVRIGAATHVLSPKEIAEYLVRIARS